MKICALFDETGGKTVIEDIKEWEIREGALLIEIDGGSVMCFASGTWKSFSIVEE